MTFLQVVVEKYIVVREPHMTRYTLNPGNKELQPLYHYHVVYWISGCLNGLVPSAVINQLLEKSSYLFFHSRAVPWATLYRYVTTASSKKQQYGLDETPLFYPNEADCTPLGDEEMVLPPTKKRRLSPSDLQNYLLHVAVEVDTVDELIDYAKTMKVAKHNDMNNYVMNATKDTILRCLQVCGRNPDGIKAEAVFDVSTFQDAVSRIPAISFLLDKERMMEMLTGYTGYAIAIVGPSNVGKTMLARASLNMFCDHVVKITSIDQTPRLLKKTGMIVDDATSMLKKVYDRDGADGILRLLETRVTWGKTECLGVGRRNADLSMLLGPKVFLSNFSVIDCLHGLGMTYEQMVPVHTRLKQFTFGYGDMTHCQGKLYKE